MNRREFLVTGVIAGAASLTGVASAGSYLTSSSSRQVQTPIRDFAGRSDGRFHRLYAPHFGMFRHHAGDDLIDQIRFMADEGFRAMEDNGLMGKPSRLQERIGRELDRLGMRMGLFVGSADFGNPTFASGREDFRRAVLRDVRNAIETARRTNARSFTIVPGRRDLRLPGAVQTSHAIDTLKYCADVCDAAGMVMLLEPLNHWGRHPEMFLHSLSEAARICRAVGGNACRVLCDVYHQQSTQQRVFADIARDWEQIGYFQLGDSPSRKEPGTGGFDFRRFFQLADARHYDGIYGMEHGNAHPGREGERAVIEAYAQLDHAALA